jgi:hypothetical protein
VILAQPHVKKRKHRNLIELGNVSVRTVLGTNRSGSMFELSGIVVASALSSSKTQQLLQREAHVWFGGRLNAGSEGLQSGLKSSILRGMNSVVEVGGGVLYTVRFSNTRPQVLV